MLVAGRDIAFDRHGDVVHAEDEMVVGDDAFGPLHQVGILEQGDQMAGAGGFDRVMQAGERADVDHALRRNDIRTIYMMANVDAKAEPWSFI